VEEEVEEAEAQALPGLSSDEDILGIEDKENTLPPLVDKPITLSSDPESTEVSTKPRKLKAKKEKVAYLLIIELRLYLDKAEIKLSPCVLDLIDEEAVKVKF
jgi:hypothetical protein